MSSDDKLIDVSLEDRGHVRCKACDRPFYPQWRRDKRAFEELCFVCLPASYYQTEEDDDYEFIEGYMMDKTQGHDHGYD